ncbi:MAG TPA: methyltransferase [Pyrinomonadaceae bacterium]|nr:methyltransferase [Pyrinomonadaceae bacterium]
MTPQPAEVPPQAAMLQLISGFWISRGVYVIAKLGIPDLLHERPMTAAELAQATDTHAPSLNRILRALVSVGILTETPDKKLALTPVSETLRTDKPGSLRWFAISELGEEHYPAWGNLMYSVKTGGIAFDNHFDMDVWEFFRQNPDNAKLFNDSMSGMTAAINEGILARYDFSGIRKIADIGGGHGGLITSILKANPNMKGVLFDAPLVAAGAKAAIDAAGLSDRCEVIGGDFFKSVPGGANAYIMKWIIHDWNDEQATTILRHCRNAITNDGRLLLVDVVVPPGSEPHFGKFIDLNMLVMTGGLERTEEEFRELMAGSGFRLTRVVSTESPFSVVEGLPA